MSRETTPDGQELLPKARKDPFDPFVQVSALTEEEVNTRRRRSSRTWKPVTLTAPFLLSVIFITIGLVVLVVWLLRKSNADQGILFAPNINDLPLRTSYLYLYLPTLVSVVYSFLWTWIDLDVKRMEPFFQLSKPGGASAEDSILLHYPFDFLAMVPIKALKRRHWSVFASSMIMVLIFWGLTPTQSGLFAIRTINVTDGFSTRYADYTHIDEQGNLSALYAQSVYNIAWLNESLPTFMTKDLMLAPFGPHANDSVLETNASYTGYTTSYSLDLICEPPTSSSNGAGMIYYESINGCNFSAPTFRPAGGNDTSKPYDAFYAGHMGSDGTQNWYLEDSFSCPDSFFARWSKSNTTEIESRTLDSLGNVGQADFTALFCTIHYHQQDVEATIALPDNSVLQVVPYGENKALPIHLIDTTEFERYSMNEQQTPLSRLDYPYTTWPSQDTELLSMPLNLDYIPQMAAFAIGAYRRPIEDYLDPITMRMSYQAAFRLLFARRLSDIFSRDLTLLDLRDTVRRYDTQAVVVIPGFAYAVLSLLGMIICLSLVVLRHVCSRSNGLRKDPSTIAALMDLSCADPTLVATFAHIGTLPMHKLEAEMRGRILAIEAVAAGTEYEHRLELKGSVSDEGKTMRSTSTDRDATESASWKGVRPNELRSLVGVTFILVQAFAGVSFTIIYCQANNVNGLPLPSSSMFVRQLVENYIPIAVATLIEPFWLVLNRVICMLQPWEEMRRGNAKASRSLELNYHSLPPQFVFWRALKARHVQLAFICLMSILANGLTLALGGLMYENTVSVRRATQFAARYCITGNPFNAPDIGFGTRSGTINDEFYRMMSNQTAHTPLPTWTDTINAYLPVDFPSTNSSLSYRVATHAVSTDLQCQALAEAGRSAYNMTWSDNGHSIDLSVSLPGPNSGPVVCEGIQDDYIVTRSAKLGIWTYPGRNAMEIGVQLTSPNNSEADVFCRQHVLAGWIRADFTVDQPVRPELNWPSDAMTMSNITSNMMLCTPKLMRGDATVEVDNHGRVSRLVDSELRQDDSTAAQALLAQASRFLVDVGCIWHSDSFPSDFTSYLLERTTGNNSFLDAAAPPPEVGSMAAPFVALYNNLFTTLVGTNMDFIFDSTTATSAIEVQGSILSPETRIFVSLPAFVVSISILSLYVITSTWIYARRPWRILPRLPTTIASIIAYFAASNALRDMGLANRDKIAPWRSWRWGYGVFVGTDGKAHVGIERAPLLMVVGKHGVGGTFHGPSASSGVSA